ncbi:myosin-11 isoform X1 [Selaginella moellendorffii]|uniref:myosin-11 isoform X1 n=1 Tax=Selaginella moellendorffii TaxID=88036 RepID=UPI000D1CBCC4|nr:myosin-11 isoform X1 [Selaginella moellendorffii]|eukprot:XP_024522243.1 myosin-11 isoform X1 [Selaginella moellendorffii]
MESHHASLGRRKLEEIRQKKATEKNSAKQSELIPSGQDQDVEGLKQELEATQNERNALQRQLDEKIEKIQVLVRDLQTFQASASNDAKLVSELKQSVKNLTVDRDAAITSKEDVTAQLRLARKRLQEAENEQYKAEEDAAVLRAELKQLQQQMEHSASSQSFHATMLTDQYAISDQEHKAVKEELHDALFQLQNNRQLLAMEQQKVAQLLAEKKELEAALASSRNNEAEAKRALANAASTTEQQFTSNKWKSKVDRGKYEQHLRELASMVERLENGRQKLLAEIDRQSLEIEKLFMENEGLVSGLNETSEIAAQWERQLRECAKQNTELENKLQAHQTLSQLEDLVKEEDLSSTEIPKLKMDLTKALGERDQLALELASVRITLNGFNRLYNPVLSSLETRLVQIKQNSAQQIDPFKYTHNERSRALGLFILWWSSFEVQCGSALEVFALSIAAIVAVFRAGQLHFRGRDLNC